MSISRCTPTFVHSCVHTLIHTHIHAYIVTMCVNVYVVLAFSYMNTNDALYCMYRIMS